MSFKLLRFVHTKQLRYVDGENGYATHSACHSDHSKVTESFGVNVPLIPPILTGLTFRCVNINYTWGTYIITIMHYNGSNYYDTDAIRTVAQ